MFTFLWKIKMYIFTNKCSISKSTNNTFITSNKTTLKIKNKFITRGSQEPVFESLYRSPGNKKTNWSYVKTMSCSGSHLGITINIKNTKFVKDHPMIDAQFRFNQCNSFREEYISVFSPYGPVLILWPVVAAILDFRSA